LYYVTDSNKFRIRGVRNTPRMPRPYYAAANDSELNLFQNPKSLRVWSVAVTARDWSSPMH